MKHLFAIAAFGCLPVFAQADCQPVSGAVQLTPGASCEALEGQLQHAHFTGDCFAVTLALDGFPTSRGLAGLTREVTASLEGDVALTPLFIPEDSDPSLVRQQILTARSAISIGWGRHRTTVYTSDLINVSRPQFGAAGELVGGFTTEQVTITHTDGKGPLAGVSGTLAVLGNSIGRGAPVVGELCN
ncbi:MAG: hypothetical protein KDH15_04540 [Rhodocyclaceae bacterium]|nr:hypothetical protein [Rhodocyclaceae bacterium]